jgi:hypothetical protein
MAAPLGKGDSNEMPRDGKNEPWNLGITTFLQSIRNETNVMPAFLKPALSDKELEIFFDDIPSPYSPSSPPPAGHAGRLDENGKPNTQENKMQ